jgi:hypothetical protein
MPYVGEKFSHDIFVSYAHGTGELRKWTIALKNRLARELSDVAEIDADIWMDGDLDETQYLTDELRKKVRGSALLLIVMSKRYLASAWCKDELSWFTEEMQERQRGGGAFFVVRLQTTDTARWPACLKDDRGHALRGFDFHDPPQGGSEVLYPFGWPEPVPGDQGFTKAMQGLVTRVSHGLRDLRKREELRLDRSGGRPSTRERGRRLYLQAASGHEMQWREASGQLRQRGFEVLPQHLSRETRSLAEMNQALQERRSQLTQSADAACVLRVDETSDQELLALASDKAAIEQSGRPLPCAVIDRVGDASEVARKFRLECIPAASGDWLGQLEGWFSRVAGSGAPA